MFFALKITHDVRMLDKANFPHIQFRITVVNTSILLFIFSLAYYRKYQDISISPLTWLGRNSYAIFLVHLLVLDLVSIHISKLSIEILAVDFIISWAVTLGLTASLIIIKKVISLNLQRFFLGV
jgi:peptidoglycan/LPS O-acetylase OafA/YrhL